LFKVLISEALKSKFFDPIPLKDKRIQSIALCGKKVREFLEKPYPNFSFSGLKIIGLLFRTAIRITFL